MRVILTDVLDEGETCILLTLERVGGTEQEFYPYEDSSERVPQRPRHRGAVCGVVGAADRGSN
jgi:hypothetical protein